jgi:hypothetical protein
MVRLFAKASHYWGWRKSEAVSKRSDAVADSALYVSIGSLVAAIASVGVSIASATIAWDAKNKRIKPRL